MKKLFLLIPLIFSVLTLAKAQTKQNKYGAANVQELGQAVFSAFQTNQFGGLVNYIPEETELQALRKKSSEDMRLLLEQTSSDSIRQNFQREFNHIIEQTTANTMNWSDWNLADTKATKRDAKNPLLYRLQLTLTNQTGDHRYIFLEALNIRNRYYLFKQMVFKSEI